jgi:hypothetical protein
MQFWVMTNLIHSFLLYLFTPLHVSNNKCSSSGGPDCINTSSGITHSGEWLSDMPVKRKPTQRPLRDNTQHHNRQTSMSLAGFEPAIPASDLPQNHALDHSVTGTVAPCSMVYVSPFLKNTLIPASALMMEATRDPETLVPFYQNNKASHPRTH